MASLLLRSSSCIVRRSISAASVRCASGPPSKPEDIHKGKVFSDQVGLPDAFGHSVGHEREELLARAAGDEDPYLMNVIKRAKGTFQEPTIITSSFNKRMVGCICEEDALSINWMTVYRGEPKRCECGYWFKLADSPAGQGHGHH
ncbi:unnamed protein product [Candidula unifasciata]|uniref:Mitochondrial cytochrome c oxidase subunit Vb n=1 Tax=Candidula unifasciata TaxID=100452 RepID=A0A8S3ZCH7_9EUPU|nr:unnamed protein product [Candidula unifasciata]